MMHSGILVGVFPGKKKLKAFREQERDGASSILSVLVFFPFFLPLKRNKR